MINNINYIWNEYVKQMNLLLSEADPLGNISINAYNYLYAIYDNMPCTTTALANMLGIKKPSVSNMVESLIAKGYLTKLEDQKDKRSFMVMLSDEALQLVKQDNDYYVMFLEGLSRFLTGEEIERLADILEKVAKGLKNEEH